MRKERRELRAANATRGRTDAAIIEKPVIFKMFRRVIFIGFIISKIIPSFKPFSGIYDYVRDYMKDINDAKQCAITS